MSLAGELKSLFELHKMGALTDAEFQLAKTRLLSGETPVQTPPQTSTPIPPPVVNEEESAMECATDAPQPPPHPVDASASTSPVPLHAALQEEITGRFPRLAPAVTALIRQQLCEYGDAPRQARLGAYKHLFTILDNLARAPQNARYRRLRLRNATLSRELWPVPGCVDFLHACGFVRRDEASAVGQAGQPKGGADNEALPALELTTDPATTTLYVQEGLNALVFCQKEMDEQARRVQTARGLLGVNVPLEIRLENARAAAAKGELESFLGTLFTKDDAGDDLLTAREHLEAIAQLMRQWGAAVADPTRAADVMTIDLDELCWYRAVVRQRGGLELLLVGAHGALRAKPTSEEGQATSATPSPERAELVLAVHHPDSSLWHMEAAQLLAGVVAQVEHTRESRRRDARERAHAAAAILMRREKKRLEHEREVAAERSAEKSREPQRRTGDLAGVHGAPSSHTTSTDSDDDEGEESDDDGVDTSARHAKGKPQKLPGKRVPLSAALAYLMGKDVDQHYLS